MNAKRSVATLILIGIGLAAAVPAVADPPPGEFLKFYQMPLNNGLTPYLVPPPPSHPAGSTYGSVTSTAIYPGHDELSTASRTNPNTPWQGTYMADDFADYAGTPIVHVRWWGSYIQNQAYDHVKQFLISFEHNIPASPTGGPSHPDPTHPGNLHQIVDLLPTPAAGPTPPPPPGMFTEKSIPIGAGPPPPEGLWEYNAELHLDKHFHEQVAAAGANNVYWLKIVALVDVQRDGPIQWGWHNRDWSIPNDLAAKPGDTPDGAERPLPGPLPMPVWHFEDDAVQGPITVTPNPTMPHMPSEVLQPDFAPQNYVLPWDGPTGIQQYSKDLAFELYTNVPEPCTLGLMAIAAIAFMGQRRRFGTR